MYVGWVLFIGITQHIGLLNIRGDKNFLKTIHQMLDVLF